MEPMSSSMTREPPRIVHALRGRLRVHLPGWNGGGSRKLESRVRQVHGVLRVQANPITSNVLVEFDPQAVEQASLLFALEAARQESDGQPEDRPAPPALTERHHGFLRRARIAVRGLDRDPRVARKVLEKLRSLPGVRAWTSILTSRVLVEYDASRVDLEELIARVMQVELPDLPGEDRPAHPLDPAPLLQSVARTVGVALGLGMLVYRRLRGGEPGGVWAAATAAGFAAFPPFATACVRCSVPMRPTWCSASPASPR
jgi:cation-transporting ATPase I